MIHMENINDLIEEYRKCAEICAETDYAEKASVKRHNKTVDKMDSIVEKIVSKGTTAIEQFAVLLDEENTGHWLSFQFLDKEIAIPDVEKRCLSLIRNQASSKGTAAIGAKYWLKEWKQKKLRNRFLLFKSFFKQ